jgi:hypothetical protein
MTMQMAAQRGATVAGRSRPGNSGRRGFFGTAFAAQTWRSIVYLVASFPIGVAFFCVFLTLIAAGLGTAVTLVGLPLLVGAMFAWCVAADTDRSFANKLLGMRVPPMPFDREAGLPPLAWRRIRLRLGNPYTWRALGYVFFRFPQGIIGFVAVNVFIGLPLWALALPFYYRFAAPEIGPSYTIDTFGEAMLIAAAAPFVFFPGIHILRGLAWLSAWVTSQMLGGMAPGETWERQGGGEPLDVISWSGLAMTAPLDPHRARFQAAQVKAFRWHAAVSASFMLLMVIINVLAAPQVIWAPWPIWGFAIPLAIHAGYLVRGWFGAHVGLYLVINIGLFVIDMNYGKGTWFFWPLTGWGIALLLQAASKSISGTRRVDTDHPDPVEDTVLSLVEPGPDSPEPVAPRGPAIAVDVEMRRVTVDGREVEMTPKEFELLVLLYENPGRPFNRGELLDRVWKNEYEVTERTVDATVVRLRRKLGGRADAIQTVWGVGYKYQAGATP